MAKEIKRIDQIQTNDIKKVEISNLKNQIAKLELEGVKNLTITREGLTVESVENVKIDVKIEGADLIVSDKNSQLKAPKSNIGTVIKKFLSSGK